MRFNISESSKAIKFGDAENPRGTVGFIQIVVCEQNAGTTSTATTAAET